MKNDVKTLAKDLRSNINWLLFEEVNFNQNLFDKYGTSPFEIQLAKELGPSSFRVEVALENKM